MKNQFVPYEIAQKMKELKFKEGCLAMYDEKGNLYSRGSFGNLWFNNTEGLLTAPLWQQAIDWLRDKHNVVINIYPQYGDLSIKGGWSYEACPFVTFYSTYHDARESAITKTLELITK